MKRSLTITLVALGTATTLAVSMSAVADVQSTDPATALVTAPTDVDDVTVGDADDGDYYVFDERCVYLTSPLDINGGNSLSEDQYVMCHLAHRDFDPTYDPPLTKVVDITMDQRVLGLITTDLGLDASDSVCGHLNVTYPNGTAGRGLDSAYTYTTNNGTTIINADSASKLFNQYFVRVTTDGVDTYDPSSFPTHPQGLDQVRIVTECP